MNNDSNVVKPDHSLLDLVRNRICPHFQFVSVASVLLGACLVIFIIEHILYVPGGYNEFLQHPNEMDRWLLDIQLLRSNKTYFYQLLTSMFLHNSYRHLVTNLIFAVFVIYEL